MTKEEVLQALYQFARQDGSGQFVEQVVKVSLAGAMGYGMPKFHGREPVMPPKFDDIDADLADVPLEAPCSIDGEECESCT